MFRIIEILLITSAFITTVYSGDKCYVYNSLKICDFNWRLLLDLSNFVLILKDAVVTLVNKCTNTAYHLHG
ncbi:hypothetical protein PUN28_002158 [Cardiocondyla obscurior]|uniref:Uncharacterized protein n=1 Tax=Cardiocondyla obscurior TaxID=286306 RepID=A0AAW2GT03_9HYME